MDRYIFKARTVDHCIQLPCCKKGKDHYEFDPSKHRKFRGLSVEFCGLVHYHDTRHTTLVPSLVFQQVRYTASIQQYRRYVVGRFRHVVGRFLLLGSESGHFVGQPWFGAHGPWFGAHGQWFGAHNSWFAGLVSALCAGHFQLGLPEPWFAGLRLLRMDHGSPSLPCAVLLCG